MLVTIVSSAQDSSCMTPSDRYPFVLALFRSLI